MNLYPIIAISLVLFIILILIIRNWAEPKHRLGYKDRAMLDKILDKNSKNEIITEKIASNTRVDSFQNSIPASHKFEQKIRFNNNILLENIANNIDTRLEELGEKVELPKKEGRGVIEERTNKNGRKYYFNSETRRFAKKEDFIKEQKDDHQVDVSSTKPLSVTSVEIDNQKYEIAKNIDTKLEELEGKVDLPKKEGSGVIEKRTSKNGKKYYFNTETRKFAKKEDFIKEQKDDHWVDVSSTKPFSVTSVEMDNQKCEIAKNIVLSEEKGNGRENVPILQKYDRRWVDVLDTDTISIKAVGIGNQKYDFGLLLLEKKRFKQAIYYFSKAIELNPDDGAPYYYRGIAKNKLNLLNDAVEDYTDAMLQKLNIVDVFYKRGNCKFRLGDTSGALKDFTKYVSIDKHNPEAYYYKGLLEYDAGNYSVVIKDLNRAIELNPNHESAYFKRGMAKEKIGDKKGCCSDLKIAIDKGNLEAYHYLKKFSN